jgi:hypothetical protein
MSTILASSAAHVGQYNSNPPGSTETIYMVCTLRP